jgi:predicted MFS family arabinose efflux permease
MGEGAGVEGAAVDESRGRAVLLVLAAVQFTNIVDFMIVMPLGPQLMRTLAITPKQFGLIVSSYTFAASAAGLLAATLVDRFDRRTAFLSLYSGFLVGTLCCGLAPTYPSLLAARVLTGAFGGILGGLAMAIIADVYPEERRGAATGSLMSAFALASVVGVPLGLVLGNNYGWHAPFRMLAVLGLVVLPGGAVALPRLRAHLHHPTAGGAGPIAEVWATLSRPEHLRAFALVVTLMVGGFSVIPYISPYLVANVGVKETSLPLVYIAGGGLTLVAAPWIGKLADRHGKFRVYRAVAPVSAALMLVVTNLPKVPLALAVAAVAALMVGNSGRMVVAMTMVTSCVEPRRRGSFMSLNSAVQHLASGLGAYVGGSIIARGPSGALTHYDLVGLIAVAATLISIGLASRLHPYAAGAVSPAEPVPDLELDLGVDPAPAAALEMPPSADLDVPPSLPAPGAEAG